MDDLRGLVTTGVCGDDSEAEPDGAAERAARTERPVLPRPRKDVRDVLGMELNEDISSEWDAPLAGRIEDQLGLPKTPWMVWMR